MVPRVRSCYEENTPTQRTRGPRGDHDGNTGSTTSPITKPPAPLSPGRWPVVSLHTCKHGPAPQRSSIPTPLHPCCRGVGWSCHCTCANMDRPRPAGDIRTGQVKPQPARNLRGHNCGNSPAALGMGVARWWRRAPRAGRIQTDLLAPAGARAAPTGSRVHEGCVSLPETGWPGCPRY